MIHIPSETLEQGVKDFLKLREYKPFAYSGSWYAFNHNGETYFRGKLGNLKRLMRAMKLETTTYAKIG